MRIALLPAAVEPGRSRNLPRRRAQISNAEGVCCLSRLAAGRPDEADALPDEQIVDLEVLVTALRDS